jgi:hypothetical protein
MFNGWTAMFNGGAPDTGYSAGHGHEGIHALRDLHATESGVGDQGVVDLRRRGVAAGRRDLRVLAAGWFPGPDADRRTTRTAEDMYENYADLPGKQKRYARRRGGEGRDEELGNQPAPPS